MKDILKKRIEGANYTPLAPRTTEQLKNDRLGNRILLGGAVVGLLATGADAVVNELSPNNQSDKGAVNPQNTSAEEMVAPVDYGEGTLYEVSEDSSAVDSELSDK